MNAAETNSIALTSFSSDLVLRLNPSTGIDVRFEISNVQMFDMKDEGL